MQNVPSTPRKPVQFNNIQILRFFAAAAVLIFHATGTGAKYYSGQKSILVDFFRHADNGVDLFFVISGFIIYYSTSEAPINPVHFMRRRVERILPIYWIFTSLIYVLSKSSPDFFSKTPWISIGHFLKSLFFVTFTDSAMPVIYVGWSLEYEMFFYASVALLAVFFVDPMRYVLIVFSILVAFGTIDEVSRMLGASSFFVRSLLIEFVFGILAAKLARREAVPKAALAAVSVATLLLVFSAPLDRAILVGIPSAFVVFLAAHFEKRHRILSGIENVLGRLGDASYSIYLVQVFVISGIFKIMMKLFPSMPLDIAMLAVALMTIFAGWLAYLFVEKPIAAVLRGQGFRMGWARA